MAMPDLFFGLSELVPSEPSMLGLEMDDRLKIVLAAMLPPPARFYSNLHQKLISIVPQRPLPLSVGIC